ncbi:hypothetical protein EV401DRAFT_457425 [Pisolithus croceorrhizus]|nr:hypothetical protein EV401DRAFT_457425 [Pisolithus croceorrhizus]
MKIRRALHVTRRIGFRAKQSLLCNRWFSSSSQAQPVSHKREVFLSRSWKFHKHTRHIQSTSRELRNLQTCPSSPPLSNDTSCQGYVEISYCRGSSYKNAANLRLGFPLVEAWTIAGVDQASLLRRLCIRQQKNRPALMIIRSPPASGVSRARRWPSPTSRTSTHV